MLRWIIGTVISKKVYWFTLIGKGINSISKSVGNFDKTPKLRNGKLKIFKANVLYQQVKTNLHHYAKRDTWRSITVKSASNLNEASSEKLQKHGKLLVSLAVTKWVKTNANKTIVKPRTTHGIGGGGNKTKQQTCFNQKLVPFMQLLFRLLLTKQAKKLPPPKKTQADFGDKPSDSETGASECIEDSKAGFLYDS